MKRLGLVILFTAMLALPALAAELEPQGQGQGQGQGAAGRPNAGGQQQPPLDPQRQIQNQIRMTVAAVYSAKFREAVGLTDDQFVKMSFFIQGFIDGRFMVAVRREALKQQLAQMRQNPSEDLENDLVLEKAAVDRRFGNIELEFIEKIRGDLKRGQAARIIEFNTKFFEEDLPKLIEQAREAAQRRQQAPPPPRQNNPNRGQQQNPGDALLPQKQR